MNGEQFKALELEQQVEYINGLLEQGGTVDNIRLELGVGKNYIGNTFKKGGYVKDRVTGYYIKAGEKATIITNATKEKTQKLNNKALIGSNSGNGNNSLEKRVESLEKELELIKAMLSNETKNNTVITDTTKVIEFDTKENISRSYKINKEVQQQFKTFCRANSQYTISDLLSNALLEYIEKFK